MSIDSDLIRGHVDTIILRTLASGDKYGYEIIDEITAKSDGTYELKQPTLYSCLKRLENQGFISSYWLNSDIGGKRHYYKLTEKGRNEYNDNMSAWVSSRSIIDKLIGEESKYTTDENTKITGDLITDVVTEEDIRNKNDEETSSPLGVMQMSLKTDDTVATPVPEEEKNPYMDSTEEQEDNLNYNIQSDIDLDIVKDYYKTDDNQINLFSDPKEIDKSTTAEKPEENTLETSEEKNEEDSISFATLTKNEENELINDTYEKKSTKFNIKDYQKKNSTYLDDVKSDHSIKESLVDIHTKENEDLFSNLEDEEDEYSHSLWNTDNNIKDSEYEENDSLFDETEEDEEDENLFNSYEESENQEDNADLEETTSYTEDEEDDQFYEEDSLFNEEDETSLSDDIDKDESTEEDDYNKNLTDYSEYSTFIEDGSTPEEDEISEIEDVEEEKEDNDFYNGDDEYFNKLYKPTSLNWGNGFETEEEQEDRNTPLNFGEEENTPHFGFVNNYNEEDESENLFDSYEENETTENDEYESYKADNDSYFDSTNETEEDDDEYDFVDNKVSPNFILKNLQTEEDEEDNYDEQNSYSREISIRDDRLPDNEEKHEIIQTDDTPLNLFAENKRSFVPTYTDNEDKQLLNTLSAYGSVKFKPEKEDKEFNQEIDTTSIDELKYKFESSGINVRVYSKRPKETNDTKYYVLTNKIKMTTSLISYAILLVLLTISAFIAKAIGYFDMEYIQSIMSPHKFFIYAGLLMAIIPAYFLIMFLINQTKKVRPKYSAKISIIFSALLFIQLLVIIYALNIPFGLYKFSQIDYNHFMWYVPAVCSLYVIIHSLIYTLLYRTKKFHV